MTSRDIRIARRLALGLLIKTVARIAAEALPDALYVEEASAAIVEVAQPTPVMEEAAAVRSKLWLRADR